MALVPIGGGGAVSTNVNVVVNWNSVPAQAGMRSFSLQLNAMHVNVASLTKGFVSLEQIVELLAVHKMVQLAESFIQTMAEMQRLETQVATLVGGFAKAEDQIDSMINLMQSAPFSKGTIVDAFVKLKASGIDPIIDSAGNGPLKDMLSAVAALGGSDDQVRRLAYAFQEMAGKGVVQTKELVRQIAIAIPSAINDMAVAFGKSRAEFLREVTKGQIDGVEAIKKLLAEWHVEYAGALELFANTFNGAILQAKGAYQQLAYDIQKGGALDPLTAGIKVATGYIREFADYVKGDVSSVMKTMTDWAFDFGQKLILVTQPLQTVAISVYQLGAGLLEAINSIPGGDKFAVGGVIGWFLFGRFGAGVGLLAAFMGDNFNAIIQIFTAYIQTSLNDLHAMGLDNVAEGGVIGFLLFGRKGLFVGLFAGLLFGILDAFSNFLGQIFQLAIASANGIKSGIAGIFNGQGFTKGLSTGFQGGAKGFQDWMKSMGFTFDAKTGDYGFGDLFGLRPGMDDTTKSAQTLTSALDGFKTKFLEVIANIRAGREAWTGLNQKMADAGPNTEQIKFMEHFDQLAQEVGARLAGAQAGGDSVLSYVVGKSGEMAEANRQLGDMVKRVNDLRAAKKFDQADQLESSVILFRDQINQVAGALGQLQYLDTKKVFDQIEEGIKGIAAHGAAKEAIATLGSIQEATDKVAATYIGYYTQLDKFEAETKKMVGNAKLQKIALDDIAKARLALEIAQEDETRAAQAQAEDALNKKNQELADSYQKLIDKSQELAGFAGYDAVSQAVAKVSQEYDAFNKQLDEQIAKNQALIQQEPEKADIYMANISLLRQLRDETNATEGDAIQRAIYNTSEIGKMWKAVGAQIDQSLSEIFTTLITGTGNLSDELMNMWKGITKAVTDYITQLVLAKIKQDLLGIAPGSGADSTGGFLNSLFGNAGFFGSLLGMGGSSAAVIGGSTDVMALSMDDAALLPFLAKGGAFAGSIKPFATGGLISGPTLFGLAGEAGQEAIMPLRRDSRGNLGVISSAHGEGDSHIHLHLHDMIDGPSVEAFFYRHSDKVVDAIAGARRLNRGVRTK